MALIVETGAGLANSESYISVADADIYHAKRGCVPWATLTTTQKEEALIRATDYIEQAYSQNFYGLRVNSTQALSWPRYGVTLNGYSVSSDTIPQAIINATAELAYRAAQGNLAPDLTQAIKREKVDVLEVEYMDNSSQVVKYRAIDNLLSAMLKSGSNGYVKTVLRV